MENNWCCPKCGNSSYETDQFAATGGGFSKIFDVQNKAFTTVTCTRCRFYRIVQSGDEHAGKSF